MPRHNFNGRVANKIGGKISISTKGRSLTSRMLMLNKLFENDPDDEEERKRKKLSKEA